MLRSLRLVNYGLFRDVRVEWSAGFTAVTGESGAGKSQLLEGLVALLGERWDTQRMGAFANATRIAAEFEIGREHPLWAAIGEGFEIEADDGLSVRREVNGEGRSLFWLQGELVPRQLIRKTVPLLVDLLRQGHVARLTSAEAGVDWLDRFLGISELAREVRLAHEAWRRIERELAELSDQHADPGTVEAWQEDLETIERASVRPGEDSALHDQLVRFRSFNHLQADYQAAAALIDEEADGGALARIRQLGQHLQRMVALDNRVAPLYDDVSGVVETLTDMKYALYRWWEAMEQDPVTQAAVEARSDLLARLKRRFGPELEDVLAYAERLRQDLDNYRTLGVRRERLAAEARSAEERYRTVAEALSARRRAGAEQARAALTDLVRQLEMPAASVVVKVEPGEPRARGMDTVSLWFAANRGQELGLLTKAASGGELARVGLAMAVLASDESEGSLLLDEVDTGLGGVSAKRVAELLAELAERRQIIAITHQPVVASRADRQVVVSKAERQRVTEASATNLVGEDRAREVSRMLSGSLDATAMVHARRLLSGDIDAPGWKTSG